MTDQTAPALQNRLGKEAWQRRLERESLQLPEKHPNTNKIFLVAKRFGAFALTSRLLRWTRLHRRGVENFEAIELVHNQLPHPELPRALEGRRILHLSDLHLDFHPGTLDALLQAIQSVEYDHVVVTGDFQDDKDCPVERLLPLARRLYAALRPPVYCCLGNHDRIRIVEPLEAIGFRFLLNEGVVLEETSPPFALCGVDDAYFFEAHDPQRARATLPNAAFRLLLNHAPMGLQACLEAGMHLCLSGHTHGGQICGPGGRPLLRMRHIPRERMAGNWSWGSLRGYTSRGAGGCNLPIRFNCPPEITLHTLARLPHLPR